MRLAEGHRKQPSRGRSVADDLPRVRLRKLRERAKMSLSDVARHLGYASPGGYHRYERDQTQGDDPIPRDILVRLVPLWRGAGNPAITVEEIMALGPPEIIPRRTLGTFQDQVVDTGQGRLVVRYRVEPDTFVRASSEKQHGAARIGPTSEYPASTQFAAVCAADGCDPWYKQRSQLHCVEASQFSPAALVGRRVLVGVPHGKGSELVEVQVARVEKLTGDDEPALYGVNGLPVAGTVLGVIVGAYIPE